MTDFKALGAIVIGLLVIAEIEMPRSSEFVLITTLFVIGDYLHIMIKRSLADQKPPNLTWSRYSYPPLKSFWSKKTKSK